MFELLKESRMSLSLFTVPVDTRLVKYINEIFKFKVFFEDADNLVDSSCYSNEIEMVIRAFVHQQNRNKLQNVQSKNLLFNISTKSWKAAKVIKFMMNQKELRPYMREVHLKVRTKAGAYQARKESTEVVVEKATEKQSNQPIVRLKRIEHTQPEAVPGPSSDINSRSATSHPSIQTHASKQDNRRKRKHTENKDTEAAEIKVPRMLDPHIYDATVNLGDPVDNIQSEENLNSNNNNSNYSCDNHSVDAEMLETSAFNQMSATFTSNKSDNLGSETAKGSSSRPRRRLRPLGVSSVQSQCKKSRNVLAYSRDRAVIHQEDLVEEMKLQQMSAIPIDSLKCVTHKSQELSLMAKAIETIVSPIRFLLGRKSR